MPYSVTINKAKPTNKVIFVGFDCDVDTNQFSLELSTSLFDSKGFSIPRKTRDKRRIEHMGFENGLNIAKRTKADEGIIFFWNKVLF
jgi:hypothetical protein